MIHTFLLALHEHEDSTAVEVCSSASQPAVHGFLDYVIILIVLACHLFFEDVEYVAV